MTRFKVSEIVVMVLALLGGLGILFLIGTRLVLLALTRSTGETAGTGGSVFAISGGVTRLFTFLVLIILALVVVGAVALWRR